MRFIILLICLSFIILPVYGQINNGGSGGGSATLPAGATNQTLYYPSNGTTVAPISLGNDLAIANSLLNTTTPADRNVSTATDTITSSDCGGIVSYNRSSAIAVGIAAASSTGLTQGCEFRVNNFGAGTATITPTTSTINGAASLAIPANLGCTIRSNSTNYLVDLAACSAVVTGSASGTVTSVSGTTANGVSYSITNPTTTPNITITLGAITPSSVADSGNLTAVGVAGIGTNSVNTGVALDLSNNTTTANSSVLLPIGTTGTRPTVPIAGMLRYNSTVPSIEAYYSSTWNALGTGSGSAVSVTANSPSIVINPTPGTGTFTVSTTDTTNAQTGTSYTILSTDIGKTVTTNNVASVAVALPVATTTGFTAGASFSAINIGTSVTTITPTTSTVNKYASEILPNGWGSYNISDGTNYAVFYSNPAPYNVGVPVVTTCGGGTLVSGSTNNKWSITGIVAATACTITFSSPLPTAPVCSFNTNTGISVGGIPSTAAVTTTMAALTGTLQGLCW